MPTLNPRVNVTLSPSLDALVSQLARLERVSKSQVLRELLEAAEPALQRAVALMDAASKASKEVRAELARSLDQAQDGLEADLSVRLASLDAASTDLVALAETVTGRRPARKPLRLAPGAGKAQDPPPSNRGVKSRKTGGKRGAGHAV